MAWDSIKNKHNRDIIKIIGSTPMTPTMLSERLKIDPVSISRYLKILRDGKLVKVRRDQNNLWYSLNQNQWKKHVEATIDLAGYNFVSNFKKISNKSNSINEVKK